MAQKLFKNRKCAKIEQKLSYPSADWPSFLRSIFGQSLFMKCGIFNCLFLILYFLRRRDTLRSNNSEGVNFFFFVGGGGFDFPKNKSEF